MIREHPQHIVQARDGPMKEQEKIFLNSVGQGLLVSPEKALMIQLKTLYFNCLLGGRDPDSILIDG